MTEVVENNVFKLSHHRKWRLLTLTHNTFKDIIIANTTVKRRGCSATGTEEVWFPGLCQHLDFRGVRGIYTDGWV